MPTPSDYTEQQLIPTLGMYALPYATTWPELSDQLRSLYIARAASIAWLPQDWLGEVLALHGSLGNVLIPAPSTVRPGIPWLRTPQQRAWWDDLAARAQGIVTAYAAGKAAEGRVQLEKLYADSAFWNKAYDIAVVLATPVTVAAAGARFANSNPLTTLLGIGAILAAILVLRRR